MDALFKSPEDQPGPWICICRTYPPNDLIVASLLSSYDIPVKVRKKEVSQLPFSTGPLAETDIAVPEDRADIARDILKNEYVKESDRAEPEPAP